jgi:hypothetical protein
MSDDTLLDKITSSINDATTSIGEQVTRTVGADAISEDEQFLLPSNLKNVLAESMQELGFPLEDNHGRVRDLSNKWHRFYRARVPGGYLAFLYVGNKVLESSVHGNEFAWIGILFPKVGAKGMFIFSDSSRVEPAYRTQAEVWEEKFGFERACFFDCGYEAQLLSGDRESRKSDLSDWLRLDKYGVAADSVDAIKKAVADITMAELRNISTILARSSRFQDDRDGSKRRGFVESAGLRDVVGDFDYSGAPEDVALRLIIKLQRYGESPIQAGCHVLGILCEAIANISDLARDDKAFIDKLCSGYRFKPVT